MICSLLLEYWVAFAYYARYMGTAAITAKSNRKSVVHLACKDYFQHTCSWRVFVSLTSSSLLFIMFKEPNDQILKFLQKGILQRFLLLLFCFYSVTFYWYTSRATLVSNIKVPLIRCRK
uniref:Uncharacterized protein n=1 Tax=Ananas comosus var. bracteatus TaxID=296719 RepID=A0A6V7QWP0_ANACO